jgi:t-SNARE complex subunit (syntaxin)
VTKHQEASYKPDALDDDELRALVKAGGDLLMLREERKAESDELVEELRAAQRAERTMADVSQLLGDFAMRVAQQAEIATNIRDNVCEVNVNVEGGNAELRKALDRGSSGAYIYIAFFLGLALVLGICDYVIP